MEIKGVHTFPQSVSLKANVITQLEFELTYFKSAVNYFNRYTMKIPFTASSYYA